MEVATVGRRSEPRNPGCRKGKPDSDTVSSTTLPALQWPLASCRHVTTSSLLHARHSTSVPRPELGKLVNYVHAFTKVRFVAGRSTICGLLLLSLRPGQPRLDSGSLSAGWFPLPDAVRGLLGCHPSVPPLSIFVDLRAAWGHVDCCPRNMRVVVGD